MLVEDDAPSLPGAEVIAEYLDETRGLGLGERRLLPDDPAGRAEVRRLMAWFNVKFFNEVSHWLVAREDLQALHERRAGRRRARTWRRCARRAPICAIICATSATSSAARNWLAGDRLTYADLAAAAHLSCLDYLGDVQWDENETAKIWYARVKSRPSFRPLLADRLPGMAPSATYADLDF